MANSKRETSTKQVKAKTEVKKDEGVKAPTPKAPETTNQALKKRKDGRLEERRNGMQIVYG